MKKLVLALAAIAAFGGSALAADLPAAPVYSKAPVVMPPVANWTGFYIFGGAGGGVWDADTLTFNNVTGAPALGAQKQGGDGYFGTVGAGYDWQFSQTWVAGIFADGQFGSLKGTIPGGSLAGPLSATEKLKDTWAAGARIGWLVAPNVFSYVNAGYTQSYWSGASYTNIANGTSGVISTSSFNKGGWFVGGGVENNLNIFGITAPGWFMKTEYRAAYFDTTNLVETNVNTGPTVLTTSFKPLVQTISTSLVYRFNWGGPVVAKY